MLLHLRRRPATLLSQSALLYQSLSALLGFPLCLSIIVGLQLQRLNTSSCLLHGCLCNNDCGGRSHRRNSYLGDSCSGDQPRQKTKQFSSEESKKARCGTSDEPTLNIERNRREGQAHWLGNGGEAHGQECHGCRWQRRSG